MSRRSTGTHDGKASKYPPGIASIIGNHNKRSPEDYDSDDETFEHNATYEETMGKIRVLYPRHESNSTPTVSSSTRPDELISEYTTVDTTCVTENDYKSKAVEHLKIIHGALLNVRNGTKKVERYFPLGMSVHINRLPALKPLQRALQGLISTISAFIDFLKIHMFGSEDDVRYMMYQVRPMLDGLVDIGERIIEQWQKLGVDRTDRRWLAGRYGRNYRRIICESRSEIEHLRDLVMLANAEMLYMQTTACSTTHQETTQRRTRSLKVILPADDRASIGISDLPGLQTEPIDIQRDFSAVAGNLREGKDEDSPMEVLLRILSFLKSGWRSFSG